MPNSRRKLALTMQRAKDRWKSFDRDGDQAALYILAAALRRAAETADLLRQEMKK